MDLNNRNKILQTEGADMYIRCLEDQTWDKMRPLNMNFHFKEAEMTRKIGQLVLDKHQSKQALSRGTQTSEERQDSIPMNNVIWNNKLENSLLSTVKINSTEAAKPISEHLNRSSYDESLTSKIKEYFTAVNLNLSIETPENFKICADCKHFKPNELKVTLKYGCVVVHGKHDEKLDEHGLIEREFTRRWCIPEDVKREKFRCLLDNDGILTILAPRKPNYISVPVQIERTSKSKSPEILDF